MPLELNLDASLDLRLLENFPLRTSTSEGGLPISTLFTLCLEDKVEVSDSKDHSSPGIICNTQECWLTTLTCFGGISPAFCQRTHQCPMLTESGGYAKLQSIINTIDAPGGTESDNQDTFLGMVLRINQSCHISWTTVPMLSMVLLEEIATRPLLLSDRFIFSQHIEFI